MKKLFLTTLVLFSTILFANAQERVSFTISNPSIKSLIVDFKSYDSKGKTLAGYGYGLNGLASHAVNLPSPVFVYVNRNGKQELFAVVKTADEGKSYSTNKKYEISREDWLVDSHREEYLKNAYDELEKQTNNFGKGKKESSIESIAKSKNLKMVKITVKGSSLLPTQKHVRVQLPWDSNPKSQIGFSEGLSMFNERTVSYPVGTKIFLCDKPYWDGSNYKEKLIVTLDEEKQNYSYKL
jgi:hypothetical protein